MACENTPVPEGMQYRDLPACNIARGYIHGNLQNGEANVNAHELTLGGIEAHNYTPDYSFGWSAEVYPDSLDFAEEEGTIGYLCPYNPHKTS
ncbi:hypothetical protein I6N95_04735 [Vagococcus sp. BWB3-3]|uniref:Uncharacterized protein n=1 Tax=Vagococcus allomyrinae TaxID=2794353 RepID=A0A940P911_9ENTE|nr:hypothetical protein [Vagococcus allomyrinae]MBP1040315.1 hypothetical protein [Vagococcus allomyrinae]